MSALLYNLYGSSLRVSMCTAYKIDLGKIGVKSEHERNNKKMQAKKETCVLPFRNIISDLSHLRKVSGFVNQYGCIRLLLDVFQTRPVQFPLYSGIYRLWLLSEVSKPLW